MVVVVVVVVAAAAAGGGGVSEWDCVWPLIGLNPTLLAEFISIKKRTLSVL